MTFDELEELISEVLSSNFTITTDKHGQVIIKTGLFQNEDGELIENDDYLDYDSDDEDEDEDDIESLDDD
jgi:hypothetical protein